MHQGQREYILYQRLILLQLSGLVSLGSSVLAQSLTRPTLWDSQLPAEMLNGPSLGSRAVQFPSFVASLRIAMSNA